VQSLGSWPGGCWLQILEGLRHWLFSKGVTLYLVMGDVFEGRYTKEQTGETKDSIESLKLWLRITLFGCTYHDRIAGSSL